MNETSPTPTPEETIEALENDLQQSKERELRALADLQNLKRRESEAKAQWGQAAVGSFAISLLPRIQELRVGLEHEDAESPLKKTVETFLESLEKTGLSPIVPEIGAVLNPDLHEVLMSAPEGEPGTIAQVLEPGWMYLDRVLQPAKVSATPQ